MIRLGAGYAGQVCSLVVSQGATNQTRPDTSAIVNFAIELTALMHFNQFHFPALGLGVFQEFWYGITPHLPILCLPIPVICEPEVA